MPLYPIAIRRCQHIKVNGVQCGSPALQNEKHCFFHDAWRRKAMKPATSLTTPNIEFHTLSKITLPLLEDANSIQVGLTEIVRLLADQQIEYRTAALMLYALQTAAGNIKNTSLEPKLPTSAFIDRESVNRRPLGPAARSAEGDREYGDLQAKSEAEEKDSALYRLVDLLINSPDMVDLKIKKDDTGNLYLGRETPRGTPLLPRSEQSKAGAAASDAS
jgi:hypothetical protein